MVAHMDNPGTVTDLMVSRGMSVNALAEAAAISRVTLTRRLADPSSFTVNELHRVAAALGVTPSALIERAGAA